MYVAANVKFIQSTYNITEYNGILQPILVLSRQSSIDIIVQVLTNDATATGE